MYNDFLNKKLITTAERKDMLTQVTRLKDKQTYNQANPSVFHVYKEAESRPDKIESTSNNVL